MRKMWRKVLKNTRSSVDGKKAWGFGIRFGYWPCMEGPYIQVTFLYWHLEVWYGLPSKEMLADK